MRPYEAIIVLNSGLGDEKTDAAIARFEKKIKDNGGSDVAVTKWGLKKLAFRMSKAKKAQDGFYVFITFNGEGKTPNELKSALSIAEDVIRYSVVLAKPEAEAAESKVEIEPSMIDQPGETKQ